MTVKPLGSIDTYPRLPWLSAVLVGIFGPFGLLYTSNLLAVLGVLFWLLFGLTTPSFWLRTSSGVFSFLLVLAFAGAAYFWSRRRPDLSRFPLLERFDRPSWLKAVGLGAVMLLLFLGYTRFVATAVKINGFSMVPTMMAGERVRANLLPTQRQSIERGTVVLYQYQESESPRRAISRVVGLVGDTIEMKKGLLYVNGRAADDPARIKALKDAGCFDEKLPLNNEVDMDGTTSVRVPDNSVYLLADNRSEMFADSRYFGAIPLGNVVGVVHLNTRRELHLSKEDCWHNPESDRLQLD